MYASASEEKRRLAAPPKRGFIVANPGPPTPLSDEGTYNEHGWEGDMSDLPYLDVDGIGRTRDEPAYRLTQEVLAYSFGKQ